MSPRMQDNPRDRVESAQQWRSAPRPVDWPARVAAVLARDKVCQWRISEDGTLCGSVDHLECDHIGDPRDHSLTNLQALCRTHHRSKTGRQGGTASQARRAKRQRPAERHPGML